MVEVDIVDSAEGHNPVIVIKQEDGHGPQFIQLNQYQAAKVANQLVEKVDSLSKRNRQRGLNYSMKDDSPLDDVFVSEEEYKKQQQNQEDKNEREIDPDSVYPSQIFSSKFYKLTDEEKKQKIAEYFKKKQTFNRINIRESVSKEHREDCKAVEYTEDGIWDTPWTFSKAERLQYNEEKDEWKDNVKTEHNRGSQYVLLKCNDTECMGALCVKSDDLLRMIPPRLEDI